MHLKQERKLGSKKLEIKLQYKKLAAKKDVNRTKESINNGYNENRTNDAEMKIEEKQK